MIDKAKCFTETMRQLALEYNAKPEDFTANQVTVTTPAKPDGVRLAGQKHVEGRRQCVVVFVQLTFDAQQVRKLEQQIRVLEALGIARKLL